MDMHPAGLPRLVGPEGSPFPHADYSNSLRYMPNNIQDELPPQTLDSLAVSRANPHPLKVRAAPSSPRGAASHHSLLIHTEHPSSPRGHLLSPPSHHVLTSATTPIPALTKINERFPTPLTLVSSDTNVAVEETLETAALSNDEGFTSLSED